MRLLSFLGFRDTFGDTFSVTKGRISGWDCLRVRLPRRGRQRAPGRRFRILPMPRLYFPPSPPDAAQEAQAGWVPFLLAIKVLVLVAPWSKMDGNGSTPGRRLSGADGQNRSPAPWLIRTYSPHSTLFSVIVPLTSDDSSMRRAGPDSWTWPLNTLRLSANVPRPTA